MYLEFPKINGITFLVPTYNDLPKKYIYIDIIYNKIKNKILKNLI